MTKVCALLGILTISRRGQESRFWERGEQERNKGGGEGGEETAGEKESGGEGGRRHASSSVTVLKFSNVEKRANDSTRVPTLTDLEEGWHIARWNPCDSILKHESSVTGEGQGYAFGKA